MEISKTSFNNFISPSKNCKTYKIVFLLKYIQAKLIKEYGKSFSVSHKMRNKTQLLKKFLTYLIFLKAFPNVFLHFFNIFFSFVCRDEILTKNKFLEEEAKRKADMVDSEDDMQQDEQTEAESDDSRQEDDVFYDSDLQEREVE